MIPGGFVLRLATLDDAAPLEILIAESARKVCGRDYSAAQVEGALRGAFGVDTQLLRDGTYYAVEHGDQLVACGGWSRRRTLFGGDARVERDSSELDPRTDAAKIRAFFVHPGYTRLGLGTAILCECERAATAQGFTSFELMATLAGIRLYSAHGYVPSPAIHWPLADNLSIEFVPMSKRAPNNAPERSHDTRGLEREP